MCSGVLVGGIWVLEDIRIRVIWFVIAAFDRVEDNVVVFQVGSRRKFFIGLAFLVNIWLVH
jgi:hypothetical protein